jgi:hypothetical protein
MEELNYQQKIKKLQQNMPTTYAGWLMATSGALSWIKCMKI